MTRIAQFTDGTSVPWPEGTHEHARDACLQCIDSGAQGEALEWLRKIAHPPNEAELRAIQAANIAAAKAMERAKEIVSELRSRMPVDDVEIDADVLGGVSIWLAEPHGDRRVWISCMNNGATTLVLTEGDSIRQSTWDELSLDRAVAFLTRAESGIA